MNTMLSPYGNSTYMMAPMYHNMLPKHNFNNLYNEDLFNNGSSNMVLNVIVAGAPGIGMELGNGIGTSTFNTINSETALTGGYISSSDIAISP